MDFIRKGTGLLLIFFQEFNMSDSYHKGTGELTLQKVTPMIEALFAGFEVTWDEDVMGACISFSLQSQLPDWGGVHEKLKDLASSMKLLLPDDSDGSLLEYVYLFITHFNLDDDPFFENIDNYRFEGLPDLEMLFDLAIRFDDGHKLESIDFEESWYDPEVNYEGPGGVGRFISRDVVFRKHPCKAAHFAQPLFNALSGGHLELAATNLFFEIYPLLLSIKDDVTRQKVRQHFIDKLNTLQL